MTGNSILRPDRLTTNKAMYISPVAVNSGSWSRLRNLGL